MVVEEPELYNLRRDPGERYNVADYNPEKVTELMEIASAARKDLGDLYVGREKGQGTREIGRLDMQGN